VYHNTVWSDNFGKSVFGPNRMNWYNCVAARTGAKYLGPPAAERDWKETQL
jgi:hypothetical protein